MCQKIVLQLLAHPSPEVRLQAYKISLSLVKEACSVSHVTEPFSVVCQKALFVLERAVLHQICCFGIYDADEKVSSVNILSFHYNPNSIVLDCCVTLDKGQKYSVSLKSLIV